MSEAREVRSSGALAPAARRRFGPWEFRRTAVRRYGRTTYSWWEGRNLYASREWLDLGDPWPSAAPPAKDLWRVGLMLERARKEAR